MKVFDFIKKKKSLFYLFIYYVMVAIFYTLMMKEKYKLESFSFNVLFVLSCQACWNFLLLG